MKAVKKEFYQGQAIVTNTYNNIMINAFWMIKLETKADKFNGSEFDDFITLFNDKTQDKTELANMINDEITHQYQNEAGAYVKEALKQVETSYSYEWLVNINNKAIETVKAFNNVDFSIVK